MRPHIDFYGCVQPKRTVMCVPVFGEVTGAMHNVWGPCWQREVRVRWGKGDKEPGAPTIKVLLLSVAEGTELWKGERPDLKSASPQSLGPSTFPSPLGGYSFSPMCQHRERSWSHGDKGSLSPRHCQLDGDRGACGEPGGGRVSTRKSPDSDAGRQTGSKKGERVVPGVSS